MSKAKSMKGKYGGKLEFLHNFQRGEGEYGHFL